MKKVMVYLLVLAMVMSAAWLVASCGTSAATTGSAAQSGTSAAASAAQTTAATSQTAATTLTKVLTSGQTVAQTAVPLIAGEEMGIFKKLGLDVKRTHYISGPPQLEALPGGAWEIGWIGTTAANTGILKYNTVVVGIAGFDYTNSCYVRADSPIYKAGKGKVAGDPELYGTAADWKGKTVLAAKGTVHYLGFLLGLKKLGLTENDVNIVHMDINAALQAFKAGQGDVFVAASSYAIEAEKLGYKRVQAMSSSGDALPGVIITTPEYIKSHPDLVVKYLEGAIETMLWLAKPENLDAGANLFVKLLSDETGTKMDLESAKANMKMITFQNLDYYEKLATADSSGQTGLQKAYNTYFDYHVQIGLGDAANKEKISKAVDATYLKQAVANVKARMK